MKVIIVRPMEKPVVDEIENGLAALQDIVGGYIQAVYPFEDSVALICNEEGKLLHLPLNRTLRMDSGEIYDIIAGTFLLCGAPPESDHFTDLTQEQVETYLHRFCQLELFL